MSLLIHIDHKNNQVLHPELMKLVPSFEALNEKEMLYVVLYADYNSIYKQFPDHERKRKAMWHAFDENLTKVIESKRITDAVSDYISLQYNPKIELARKYQKKIDQFLEGMENDTAPTSIAKTITAIEGLRSSIRALEKEVDEDMLNEGVVKGKMTLSWLEKVKTNRKLYLSIVSKK